MYDCFFVSITASTILVHRLLVCVKLILGETVGNEEAKDHSVEVNHIKTLGLSDRTGTTHVPGWLT